jgi:hypothetical protein
MPRESRLTGRHGARFSSEDSIFLAFQNTVRRLCRLPLLLNIHLLPTTGSDVDLLWIVYRQFYDGLP